MSIKYSDSTASMFSFMNMAIGKDRSLLMYTSLWYLLVFVALDVHAYVAHNAISRNRRFKSSVTCGLFGYGCEDEADFGVLLDAGSSSTKLKVYTVAKKKDSTSSLPIIQLVHSQRFSPGLDSFADDENGDTTRKYLADIVSVAKEKIPNDKHKDTPILLFATAGLRFLDADVATRLVDTTKAILSDPKVSPFKYKASGVGILSGEEEGVYAWVAVNYLLGFFNGARSTNESVGILEMGGGSTQIAFIPKSPLYDGEFQVRILNRLYELYVHSYLLFGMNSINLRIATALLERNPKSVSLKNPCMLRDDSADVQLDNGVVLKMSGTSNPALCRDILEDVLAPETGINCQPKPCAIGTVYQPSVDSNKFYATQAFTYAPSTLKVIDKDEVLHLDRLEEAAFEHCGRSLSDSRRAGIKDELASSTCLMGLYIPTLLIESYGFPPDTTNIKITSQVGNNTIDWSLGLMVIELTGNSVKRRR